jgi:hypothetical protein
MFADYCPVPDIEGVCKYEEREEVYQLTPKGCLHLALYYAGIKFNEVSFDYAYEYFHKLMKEQDYIQEEK